MEGAREDGGSTHPRRRGKEGERDRGNLISWAFRHSFHECRTGVGHGQHFALAKDALYLSSVWVIETSGSWGGHYSSRQPSATPCKLRRADGYDGMGWKGKGRDRVGRGER